MNEPAFTYTPSYNTNMRSTDRIFVLAKMEGKDVKSTTGLVDNRLFSGDNRLHAKMDGQYGLWYLQMDSGLLAEPLKQKWTSFAKLKEYVTSYFARRNVLVKEVLD